MKCNSAPFRYIRVKKKKKSAFWIQLEAINNSENISVTQLEDGWPGRDPESMFVITDSYHWAGLAFYLPPSGDIPSSTVQSLLAYFQPLPSRATSFTRKFFLAKNASVENLPLSYSSVL